MSEPICGAPATELRAEFSAESDAAPGARPPTSCLITVSLESEAYGRLSVLGPDELALHAFTDVGVVHDLRLIARELGDVWQPHGTQAMSPGDAWVLVYEIPVDFSPRLLRARRQTHAALLRLD